MELTSPAFTDGGEIPRECGYKNGNRAPSLKWELNPDIFPGDSHPQSFALIMDDPDAMGAVGKVWVHYVAWNISWFADGKPNFSGRFHINGMNDFGEVGYGGPAPPDKRHSYVFKLYALDCELDLPRVGGESKSTKADVEKAMEGHIIEQTQLTGTYAPD